MSAFIMFHSPAAYHSMYHYMQRCICYDEAFQSSIWFSMTPRNTVLELSEKFARMAGP